MKSSVIPTPSPVSVILSYPSARGVIEAAVVQGHDFMLVSRKFGGVNHRNTMSNSKACMAALLQRNIASDPEIKTWERDGQTNWLLCVVVKQGRKKRSRDYYFKTTQTHLHFQAMLAAQAEAAALHADLGSLAPRRENCSPPRGRAPRL